MPTDDSTAMVPAGSATTTDNREERQGEIHIAKVSSHIESEGGRNRENSTFHLNFYVIFLILIGFDYGGA